MFGSTLDSCKCKLLTSKKFPSKFISEPNFEHWILKAPKDGGVSNRANTVNVSFRLKSVFYKDKTIYLMFVWLYVT